MALGAWVFLLIVLHAIPRETLIDMTGGESVVRSTVFDKITHAGMFGTLAGLAILGRCGRSAVIIGVGTLYGIALEAIQGYLVPGRTASLEDVLSDAFGLVLGILLARRFLAAPLDQ